jgi:hypothetical protein
LGARRARPRAGARPRRIDRVPAGTVGEKGDALPGFLHEVSGARCLALTRIEGGRSRPALTRGKPPAVRRASSHRRRRRDSSVIRSPPSRSPADEGPALAARWRCVSARVSIRGLDNHPLHRRSIAPATRRWAARWR